MTAKSHGPEITSQITRVRPLNQPSVHVYKGQNEFPHEADIKKSQYNILLPLTQSLSSKTHTFLFIVQVWIIN